jgi:peptide/nickel transport system substrate-binding protein
MRKKLTLLSLLLILALLMAACGGAQPAAEEQPPAQEEAPAQAEQQPAAEEESIAKEGEVMKKEEAAAVSEFGESPMLAEMVAAGDLPPVEERLPTDVQVIDVVDKIGEYGGTWHAVGWAPDMGNIKMTIYDPPIRWQPDYGGYEPGLAKEIEWSDDGTQVTWHFREGVKWSSGEPFTMEDMKFWWEDFATNEDYKVVTVPWWGFNRDGSPMEVTFPDDYTMVMTWDWPQWITPYIVAQGFWEWEPLMKPKHFLQDFHPNYTDGATYEGLEQADKWWETPGYPTLMGWYVEDFKVGETTTWVRNPYYWKTDPEGNQLPYIDRIVVDLVADREVRLLEVSQGKYDATFRGSDQPQDIPFLLEQADSGGYEVYTGWVNGAGGWPCWLINQDYVGPRADADLDEEIRTVLRDVNFRKGVSHAMNRDRLVNVVWEGIGTPQQATISPQAWHFQSPEGQAVFEEWQQADVSYDPDLAAELFETAGVVDADGDGVRDLPSGKPFEIILDLGDWGGELVSIESTEVFREDLEAAGFNVIVNNLIGQPDWTLRQTEALYMFRNCHASEVDIWTYPDWIFPLRDNRAWPLQGKWRQTGGEEGEQPEPASPAARLQEIYEMGLAEPDAQKRHELVWDAIRIHIEEGPFTLGAAGDQPMPVVIKNGFCNVPETGVLGPWAPGSPGNKHPEQFYMSSSGSCD